MDYGSVFTVAAADMKPLRHEWAALPAQAVRGRLAGCRPSCSNWRWPLQHCKWFLERVHDTLLHARVLAVDHQVCYCYLAAVALPMWDQRYNIISLQLRSEHTLFFFSTRLQNSSNIPNILNSQVFHFHVICNSSYFSLQEGIVETYLIDKTGAKDICISCEMVHSKRAELRKDSALEVSDDPTCHVLRKTLPTPETNELFNTYPEVISRFAWWGWP